ncbi:MAG: hypothetical protein BGO26_05340 [Actinobacteria bacterium 69-20]|nr:MAG: hypothetical protein BGO26_05340 [Actinobacteria bacterium 69-20]
MDSGSAIPSLSRDQFVQLPLELPSIEEQRRIAGVLGALDDLIDTNRQLASRLEDQASCLFASYRFDAEPDSTTMAFGDLVDVNPKIPKPTGDAPYVDMSALPTDSSRISQVSIRPATGGARFQNGDALLARITPCLENGKVAFVDVLEDGEVAVGSTEFLVLRGRPRVGPHWPYLFTRSPRFRDYAIQNMNGSSGRQRCSASAIVEYQVAPPHQDDLAQFKAAAEPLFAAIGALGKEIADLTRARGELLPLLMSGRVRVREGVA